MSPQVKTLHVCPRCGSEFVYPRSIEEQDDDVWELELHCPECGWTETGVFGLSVTEEFMNVLDQERNELQVDLAKMIQANMAEYVELFAAALEADAIYPVDF
jgi:DNA-directed RNA polymerase subunit RPC12/RpoP